MQPIPTIVPVILCGGDGTRLWPASRKALPKQFMPFAGSTLFKKTVERAYSLKSCLGTVQPPIIICNSEHRFLAGTQVQDVCSALDEDPKSATIILEPCGRNTAPAIAIAALHASADNALLFVMPSDHFLPDPANLFKAVAFGAAQASQCGIITFGIQPTGPETGYGYIQKELISGNFTGCYSVAGFVEKPDKVKAQAFLDSGNYLWNSGLFLFSVSTLVQAFNEYAPNILSSCKEAYAKSERDLDFIRLEAASFELCPSDSIDYAIMEKVDCIKVIQLDTQWSDLGSWQAVHEVQKQDAQGNSAIGDTFLEGCTNTLVHSQSRLVAAVGINDAVIVETPDAVMVASLACSQDVKKIVKLLKKQGRPEAETHARVYRPWGSYESLVTGPRFQVKRIIVLPGQRLSRQLHYHRAEHWVVVLGTAKVLVGDNEVLLTEDESTYIPVGSVHCLENPGKVLLEIIEIQTGSYLGEDDILRLEDLYGR